LAIIGEDGIVQATKEKPLFGTIKEIAVVPWNGKFHERSPRLSILYKIFRIMEMIVFLIFF
jgi:hypothetical protein